MITKNAKIVVIATMMFSLGISSLSIPIANAVEDIEPQLNTRLNELLQEEISIQTKILELKSLMEESSKSSMQNQIVSLESRLNTIYSELDTIQAKYKELYAMSKEEGERITPHLENLQAKQLDLREQGIPVVSIGLGGRVHGIVIGLDGTIANSPASVDEFTQMLSKHIPNDIPWSVHTEESVAYQTDPCTSRQNCDPVVGGAEIEVKNKAGCTFGYEATRSGVNGFVTAGHCADGQVGQDVGHPEWNNDFIGTVAAELFFNNSDCDCAFVNTAASAVDSKIFLAASFYSLPTDYVASTTTDLIGHTVKISGISSGVVGGAITAINTTHTDGTTQTISLTDTNISTSVGDSGAPYTSLNGTLLYGSHNAPSGKFVPVDRAIAKLFITPVLN